MLGICLGKQTLAMYSVKQDNPDKRIIKDVDTGVDHWPRDITRDDHEFLCHNIKVNKNSKLYELMDKEEHPMVNSFHHRTITEVGSLFKVSAYSDDGLIEGLEYEDSDRYIIGVQFHPEHFKLYPKILSSFIEACLK